MTHRRVIGQQARENYNTIFDDDNDDKSIIVCDSLNNLFLRVIFCLKQKPDVSVINALTFFYYILTKIYFSSKTQTNPFFMRIFFENNNFSYAGNIF